MRQGSVVLCGLYTASEHLSPCDSVTGRQPYINLHQDFHVHHFGLRWIKNFTKQSGLTHFFSVFSCMHKSKGISKLRSIAANS